jgi:hypothetical protein
MCLLCWDGGVASIETVSPAFHLRIPPTLSPACHLHLGAASDGGSSSVIMGLGTGFLVELQLWHWKKRKND